MHNQQSNKVRKQIVEAIATYQLIEEGDKVMVCVSGGKDSSVLLVMLSEIQKRAPYSYQFEAVMLDQGQPGFNPAPFQQWVESLGIRLHIIKRDTYSIVKEKVTDGVYCSLCSRLRRAILYDFAVENGFTKLALGHHREDFNETLFLNLLYTGKIASMSPKLVSDDGRNVVIRPMMFVAEADLVDLSREWRIPILPCNLCGSQEGLKRKYMKNLISDLEKTIPSVRQSMIGAMGNIRPSHLLDQKLWDFSQSNVEENQIFI